MLIKRLRGRVLVTALVLAVVLAGWVPRVAVAEDTTVEAKLYIIDIRDLREGRLS